MEPEVLSSNMNFSEALYRLKEGRKIARSGWNGKGMWIAMSSHASTFPLCDNEPGVSTLPFLFMKTANDEYVPWVASQSDILADDWEVVHV